jgi:hypothetical protein
VDDKKIEVDASLLNYYKDYYSGHKIIYVRYLDIDFIFRTITRKEYKYLLQSCTSDYDLEDKICNTACVYPDDYEFELCGFAGLNEYVADKILQLSGFKDVQDILNDYRQVKANVNLEIQCMDLIKAFIPEYSYEEMEEWTWEKLMYMTARAEKIAELKGFDWKIQDRTEEYMEEVNKINSDNKEFIQELQNNGIDPMFYFADELKSTFTHDLIEFPLISGINWNDEVILDAIRKQVRKKNII